MAKPPDYSQFVPPADISQRDAMAFLYSLAFLHGASCAGGRIDMTPAAVARQAFELADAMVARSKVK